MKILSQLALTLFIAGLLAILLLLIGAGPRWSRFTSRMKPVFHAESELLAAQPPVQANGHFDDGTPHPDPNQEVAPVHVRIPAIRGETNYGWVQLPRGTNVDLVHQNAANLIVRWEGTMVQVPQDAVISGAIALRQNAKLAGRN